MSALASLTILVLPENRIGDEGAKAIGNALSVNGTLKHLCMYLYAMVSLDDPSTKRLFVVVEKSVSKSHSSEIPDSTGWAAGQAAKTSDLNRRLA